MLGAGTAITNQTDTTPALMGITVQWEGHIDLIMTQVKDSPHAMKEKYRML